MKERTTDDERRTTVSGLFKDFVFTICPVTNMIITSLKDHFKVNKNRYMAQSSRILFLSLAYEIWDWCL